MSRPARSPTGITATPSRTSGRHSRPRLRRVAVYTRPHERLGALGWHLGPRGVATHRDRGRGLRSRCGPHPIATLRLARHQRSPHSWRSRTTDLTAIPMSLLDGHRGRGPRSFHVRPHLPRWSSSSSRDIDLAAPHRSHHAPHSPAGPWQVFAVCRIFASPWWDRRGRQPLIAWVDSGTRGSSEARGRGRCPAARVPSPGRRDDSADPDPRRGHRHRDGGAWRSIIAWALVWRTRRSSDGRCLLDARSGAPSGRLCAAALAAMGRPGVLGGAAPRSGWCSFAERSGPAWRVDVTDVSVAFVARGSAADAAGGRCPPMRRSTDRADQILEGRAEIASMIAHEVRGPVTTIRGIASTASTHYQGLSDEERREFFDLIEQESRRLLSAVDQTSLALKIDAGSLTYQKAPAPLATIVRAGVDAAGVPADLHTVHVLAQEDVSLVADASRLTEMVRQLVENAGEVLATGHPHHRARRRRWRRCAHRGHRRRPRHPRRPARSRLHSIHAVAAPGIRRTAGKWARPLHLQGVGSRTPREDHR